MPRVACTPLAQRAARWLAPAAAVWLAACAHTETATPLPPEIQAALARAQLEPRHLAAWVSEVGHLDRPLLAHRADEPVNPASVMKLVTSVAALQLLGASYTWPTSVYFGGPLREDGVLEGPLVIQGHGDPVLVTERLALLMQRVRAEGVGEIRGDIVLDREAFAPPAEQPGDFDGEALRPYNVQPDALLINYKSVTLTFRPDAARGVAVVTHLPALAGMAVPASVPLQPGDCDDWVQRVAPDVTDPQRVSLRGTFPAGCGERSWSFAYAEPNSYAARAVAAAWQAAGGSLTGEIREGLVPPGATPVFQFTSPPLAQVLRDMNKTSSNVIAQQLFLTMGLVQQGSGTPEAARAAVAAQMQLHPACTKDGALVLDNGSGRSRQERLSAHCLAQILDNAWTRPWMPELLASLPVAGEDTARRALSVAGRAHLKTGSLRDVAALAGFVHGPDGRRVVVVAFIDHPQAGTPAARVVPDSVLRWTWQRFARSTLPAPASVPSTRSDHL